VPCAPRLRLRAILIPSWFSASDPTRPETGYGYIHVGKQISRTEDIRCFAVKRFVEKPTLARARMYASSRTYLWNSGMFVWKTSVILEEFKRSMPALYRLTLRATRDGFTKRAIDSFYSACESQSIDYGIMENAARIVAVRGTFFWDDIGSWEAMSRIHTANKRGTVAYGEGVFESDCEKAIVYNASQSAVAAIGLKGHRDRGDAGRCSGDCPAFVASYQEVTSP